MLFRSLIEAEATFWQRILDNRWPEPADDELDLDADPDWRAAALQYRGAKTRLDRATAEEQQARKLLERMATARRTYGGGIEVLRSFRKGAVDYSGVPELRAVDLEPYRKATVEVVKVNLSGRPRRSYSAQTIRITLWTSISVFVTSASSSARAEKSSCLTIC